jgi:hypothetical protein
MMSRLSLADLAETYPDASDPDFNKKIADKKEFVGPEYLPKYGDARAHQRNAFRLLGAQSGPQSIMIVWNTGMGKSLPIKDIIRSIIDFPERFGRKFRCIIAVKAAVIPSWQAELAKSQEFTTVKLRSDSSSYEAQGRTHALSAAIGKKVKLVKLDKFAKKLSRLTGDEIRAKYSVDMVVIDEAHFLRTIKDIKTLKEDSKIDPRDEQFVSKITYIQTKRLAKYAEIGLKISLTATPMYDSPEELVSTTSFTQPLDKQLSLADFQRAYSEGRDALKAYLEPKLRGHISVISGMAGLPPVFDQGRSFQRVLESGEIVESIVKVVSVEMLPEQEAVYRSVVGSEDNGQKTERSNETFYVQSRQSLRFIFIDPTKPSRNTYAGFEDEIYAGKVIKESFIISDPPLRPAKDKAKKDGTITKTVTLQTAKEQIEKKATEMKENGKKRKGEGKQKIVHKFKFRFEAELFKDCPPRPSNLKAFGKGSELDPARLKVIKRMSASYAKVIQFVHSDMRYQNEGEMAFYFHPWIRNGGCIPLGMCFDLMGYERFDGIHNNADLLDERPRYAFMTGEPGSTAARNRNIRDVANHPSNRFGQKIMIVLASDVSAVGVSFINGRKFIYGGPTFNLIHQPEGRVRRTDSHRFFPEARQKFVRRYLMATSTSGGEQTVDHDVWWLTQQKDQGIEPVSEILSEISIESGLFNQDVREEYNTVQGVPRTDLSTYHLFWADKEMAAIEQRIRECYRIKTSWALTEFNALLSKMHDSRTIVWTLADMISRQDIINDRFGFPHPLREHNGVYFLGSLMSNDRLEEDYVKNIKIEIPDNFRLITETVVKESAKKEEKVSLVEFKKKWTARDVATGAMRVASLENALTGQISDPEVRNFVLTDLQVCWARTNNYIFHYLEETRPKGNSGSYQNNKERIDSKKGDVIIRILENNGKNFRNANLMEIANCVKIINANWIAREEHIKANLKKVGANFLLIYNVSSDRELRIKKLVAQKISKTGKPDGRSERGKVVTLYTPLEIVEFLWEIKVPNSEGPEDIPSHRNVLIRELGRVSEKIAEEWSIEKMQHYYSWLMSDNHGRKERMIAALKDYFVSKDLLFVK